MAVAAQLAAESMVLLKNDNQTNEQRPMLQQNLNGHCPAVYIDSRVTGRITGHPVRALRNDMTKRYLELEKKGASFEELEQLTLGGLRKAVVDGDVKDGSVMAGQIAGLVKERMSCKELLDRLVAETDALMKGTKFYE